MGVYAHKTRENPGKRLDFRKKLGIPGKKICLCPIVKTNQTDFHTSGRDRRAVPKPCPGAWIRTLSPKPRPEPESAPAPKPRPGAGIRARSKVLPWSWDPHLPPKPRPGAGIHVVQKSDPESGVRTAGILALCPKVPVRARNSLLLDQIHPPSSRRIWPVR